ncbi:phosphate ABC transporter permease PstA [Monashia sp. NPDC004114]
MSVGVRAAETADEGMPSGAAPSEASLASGGVPANSVAGQGVSGRAEVRRTARGVRQEDVLAVLGALGAGVGLAAITYYVIAPFSGTLGFIVLAFGAFLGCYVLLVRMDGDRELVKDRVASVLAHSLGLVMLLGLVVVVAFALWQGLSVLTQSNFYTEDMAETGPLAPLSSGGVKHAIVGTLVMITIALAITIPLAVVCAVFLSESRSPFARFVRTIVEAMTALPSVVAGLFVYAAIITLQERFHWGSTSGLAASVALSVMMLPIMIRAADVVLRLVPGNLKEAAEALGAPRWKVIWHVVLPTARSGLMTAIILGTARGIGETSPVLLTAGYTTGFNVDPLHGPMVSLPLLTFSMTKSPEPGYVARGFGAATVLMVLVLLLFVAARVLGGRAPGDLTKRQRRRRAQRSAEDLAYFDELAAADAELARQREEAVKEAASQGADERLEPELAPPATDHTDDKGDR